MTPRAFQVAGGLLLAMVAMWAGFRMHAGAPRPAAVKVPAGEASPPLQSDLAALPDPLQTLPKIPERLPEFSLPDRHGIRRSISTWRDRSLVINFWATWCAPCRREIPLLESIDRSWSTRGVEVVGIAVDRVDKVAAFADELKIRYPLLIGEQDALDVAGALGFESPVFPFTVFTDRRGEVVALFVGELRERQAELILGVVQNLNDHRLGLPEARRSIAAGLQELGANHPG